jgi:hypothetical protein
MSRLTPLYSSIRSAASRSFILPSRPAARATTSIPGPSIVRHASSGYARQESLRDQLLRPTTIVLVLVPIFTFGLGCWQIQRLRWKVGLIEEVERNMKREPMVLPPHIKWVPFQIDQLRWSSVQTLYHRLIMQPGCSTRICIPPSPAQRKDPIPTDPHRSKSGRRCTRLGPNSTLISLTTCIRPDSRLDLFILRPRRIYIYHPTQSGLYP